jgi:hypothetical protein
MIELECEICGKIFLGTKKRPITICPECAGKLRKIGLGPVQLLEKPRVKISRNPEIKTLVINKMKEALGYPKI